MAVVILVAAIALAILLVRLMPPCDIDQDDRAI